MRSGVSPFGIAQRCSPVFMSIATILLYPKEAILPRFELPVTERYFPEYARTIASRVWRNPHGRPRSNSCDRQHPHIARGT